MNHSSMTLQSRLMLLVAGAMLAALALAALGVWMNASRFVEGRRGQLVAAVDTAHSIVMAFQAKAKAGQMEPAQAHAAAVAALRGARYGSGDYFWRSIWQGVAVCAAVLLILGGVAWMTWRSVLRQLGGEPAIAAGVVAEVAQGHLDVRIPAALQEVCWPIWGKWSSRCARPWRVCTKAPRTWITRHRKSQPATAT